MHEHVLQVVTDITTHKKSMDNIDREFLSPRRAIYISLEAFLVTTEQISCSDQSLSIFSFCSTKTE